MPSWKSTAFTLFLLQGIAAANGESHLRPSKKEGKKLNEKAAYEPKGLQMTANEVDPFVSAVATGRNYKTALITGMINEQETEGDISTAKSFRCFLGTLDVHTLKWQDMQTYAHPGKVEHHSLACNNVLLWRHKHEVFVAGHDDMGATSKGSILALTEEDMEHHLDADSNLVDRRVGKGVNPSILMAHKDRIYMAGVTTPDETEEQKHGLKVSSYQVNDDGSMEGFFKHVYYTDNNEDLHVAGMMMTSWDTFLVAGHTRVQGGPFGYKSNAEQTDSIDGFVTQFNAETGRTVEGESTFRFDTLDGDVEIHSICHDRNDKKHVYLVGSLDYGVSNGIELDSGLGLVEDNIKTKSEAIILKVDLSENTKVWEKRMTAEITNVGDVPRLQGRSCTVTPDGTGVWFGGHVYDNGKVLGTKDDAMGGTDIFVSLLSVEDGKQSFVRQIGSTQDDLLADKGGLVVDAEGNAVVAGNTYGSLYREKHENEDFPDMFISTIALATGDTAETI